MIFFDPTIINTCSDRIFDRYISGTKNESSLVRNLLSIYDLTNEWGNRVLEAKNEFDIQEDSYWQISGYLKKYTWVRIFPRGFSKYRIYYTLGIDFIGKQVVYKIDCQRRGKTKLSNNQIRQFDKFMAERRTIDAINWQWQEVSSNDIPNIYPNKWNDLIPQTIQFIEDSFHIYNQAIEIVWGLQQPAVKEKKISLEDLLNKQERDREQGRAAEEFVLRFEKLRLSGSERIHQIEIISDYYANAGYDIKSFHSPHDKLPKRLIEVKSYQGEQHFYWSENEMYIADKERDNYFIYLVDFNKISDPTYTPLIIGNPFENIFGNKLEWNQRAKSILFEKNK